MKSVDDLVKEVDDAITRSDDEVLQRSIAELRSIGTERATAWADVSTATSLCRMGLFKEGMDLAQKALIRFERSDDVAGQARVHVTMGTACKGTGDYSQSIDATNQALNLYEHIGDLKGVSICLGNNGNAYFEIGDYHKALDNYTNALQIDKQIGDDEGVAFAYERIACVYSTQREHERSIELFKESMSMFEAQRNRLGVARIMSHLAFAYLDSNDPLQSLQYGLKSSQLLSELNEHSVRTVVLQTIGQNYLHRKDFVNASRYFREALLVSEQQGLRGRQATLYDELGKIYRLSGRFDQALQHHRKALDLNEQLGRAKGVAQALLHIGNALYDSSGEEEALEYYNRARVIALEQGYPKMLQILDVNMASCLIKMQRFNEATSYNESVGERSPDDPLIEIERLRNRAMIAERVGRDHEVRLSVKEALVLAEQNGFRDKQAEMYRYLRDYSLRIGDLEGYAVHNIEYLRMIEEDPNNDPTTNLLLYEAELKIAAEQRALEEEKLRRRYLEDQLALTTTHLASQAETFSSFKRTIQTLIKESSDPYKVLADISHYVRELPVEEVDWVRFERDFVALYPEFTGILIEKYPSLTKQEVKMCQLTRIGLKSHEIAKILSLSERSVDSHRYNIRKKLGLHTKDNLVDVLRGL